MPIDERELNNPANTHLMRPAGESILAALRAWRALPNRYEWWWLIINHDGERYTAIRFSGLRELLQNPDFGIHMNTRLVDLPLSRLNPDDWEHPFPGVVVPVVVEQTAISSARAHQVLNDSPGKVVVVLQNDQFHGILSGSERTFAFADKPLLDMLAEFEQPGDDDTHILPALKPDIFDSPTAPAIPPEE